MAIVIDLCEYRKLKYTVDLRRINRYNSALLYRVWKDSHKCLEDFMKRTGRERR